MFKDIYLKADAVLALPEFYTSHFSSYYILHVKSFHVLCCHGI